MGRGEFISQGVAAHKPRRNRHHAGIRSACLRRKAHPAARRIQQKARVRSLEDYRELYAAAAADPETFWGDQAKLLHWFEAPKKVLEWNPPHAKWFVGGKLNVSYNCVDRHLEKNANKPALMWEGEDG